MGGRRSAKLPDGDVDGAGGKDGVGQREDHRAWHPAPYWHRRGRAGDRDAPAAGGDLESAGRVVFSCSCLGYLYVFCKISARCKASHTQDGTVK